MSPMCLETGQFEPPCESHKGLKRTGHKHVVLPIAFLIHTTENSVPYKHSLKCLLNLPHTHFGFQNNKQFSFKWFVADNSRHAQNAARAELSVGTVILNCQDHLVRKFNKKKISVNNTENLPSIEMCVRAMSRAASANIQRYIFDVTTLYTDVWNELNCCTQFRRYYMNEINCRWYDTAFGFPGVRPSNYNVEGFHATQVKSICDLRVSVMEFLNNCYQCCVDGVHCCKSYQQAQRNSH